MPVLVALVFVGSLSLNIVLSMAVRQLAIDRTEARVETALRIYQQTQEVK